MELKLPKEKSFVGPALIWKRIFAFVIDIFIINFIILYPLKGIFEGIVPESAGFNELMDIFSSSNLAPLVIAAGIFGSVIAILYFMVIEGKFGQSPGKMLFGINVSSEDKNPGIIQNLIRNMFLLPVFPFVLLWILDPFFLFFTKDKKRLSDILSRTRVTEKFNY